MNLATAEVINSVLRGAAKRLVRADTWASKHMARTADGANTMPEATNAVAWCAFGAIRAEAFALIQPGPTLVERGRAVKLAEQASKHLGAALMAMGQKVHSSDAPRTVMEWNDEPGRTHADVIELYRRALKTTRKPVARNAVPI